MDLVERYNMYWEINPWRELYDDSQLYGRVT